MRIIAGELKGRRLVTPADNRVRPTTDKVKEAVFSMISAYLPDSVVVDLFAGTGNLGLEAISRGAKRAYFIDRDRASIAMVRENVKYCKVEDRSVIIWSDYVAGLKKINDKEKRNLQIGKRGQNQSRTAEHTSHRKVYFQ